jgi:hypothetical protein
MHSVKKEIVSTALEAVVEACILLSGLPHGGYGRSLIQGYKNRRQLRREILKRFP